MTNPDYRAELERIIDAHDADEGMSVSRWAANLAAAIASARALLAQPEPPELTDEELRELRRNPDWPVVDSLLLGIARAAIAADRARRLTPQPPADGEVAELVGWLQSLRSPMCNGSEWMASRFDRIASLLLQGQSSINRQYRLQQESARFREPERTILCDLLANGTLLPDPDGIRYGLLIPPTTEVQ